MSVVQAIVESVLDDEYFKLNLFNFEEKKYNLCRSFSQLPWTLQSIL